ncbi:heterokaryon incompatibility, partial [Pyrenochaeta sp. DS3sAY3a]
LREISLDSPEPFDALSYVWENDSSALNTGIPSSKQLEISKSCYIALQNLRDHHRVRTIWVDAICIDQTNNSEKNMQIPLMKEIYGKARKVYIWLGES